MPPVTPKPASTVVLVRDRKSGPEVLLLRRPDRGFAAGAWVFPGGTVDVDDYRLNPPSSEEPDRWGAMMRMRDARRAWAHVVAAVRETWEETGLLLFEDGSAESVGQERMGIPMEGDAFASIAGRVGFRPAPMVYLSRWITPESEPRRYDTRFFVARTTEGREIRPAAGEVEEAIWIRPSEALRRVDEATLRMMLPTRYSLRSLAAFRTTDEMLEKLKSETPASYLPRMRTTPEGVIIDVHPLDLADDS